MPDSHPSAKNPPKSRIITHAFRVALKLWLKSQVSQLSHLDVEVRANDREVLSGCMPWICISAIGAVYKGIHITDIQILAENIHVNIGSILKGKPLKLLQKVPVRANLRLDQESLNSSLSSELLSTVINDLIFKLFPPNINKIEPISWQKIILGQGKITLLSVMSENSDVSYAGYINPSREWEVHLNLDVTSGQILNFSHIKVLENGVVIVENEYVYKLDLGSEVDIQELSLAPGRLVCQGRINVNP